MIDRSRVADAGGGAETSVPRGACDGAGANRCGECGPPPEETCNGYDDNCDGVVDERCVVRLGDQTGPAFVTALRLSGTRALMLRHRYNPRTHVRAWLEDWRTHAGAFIDPRSMSDFGTTTASDDFAIAIDGDFLGWMRLGTQEIHIRNETTGTETVWTGGALADLDRDRALVEINQGAPDPRRAYEIRDLRTAALAVIEVSLNARHGSLAADWFFHIDGPWPVSTVPVTLRGLHLITGERVAIAPPAGENIAYAVSDGDWLVWTTLRGRPDQGSPSYTPWALNLRSRETQRLEGSSQFARIRVDQGVACWHLPTGETRVQALATGRRLDLPSPGGSEGCDVSYPTVGFIEPFTGKAYLRHLLPGEP